MIAASHRRVIKCLAASATALALVACGNSSSPVATAPVYAASDFSGPFVFSVSGTDPNDGDYSIAGTFTADGKGNVTGVADYNLGSGIDSNVALTGTYTASNGVATINFTDGGSVQESYFVPIVKTGTAAFTRYDGTGSGTLYAAAPVTSAPAGTYVVALSGEGDNAVTATANFALAAGGTYSAGTESYTDGTNMVSATNGGAALPNYASNSGFLYPVKPNGRGQAAIGGNTFSYYLATASQAVLLGLDDRTLLKGTATKQ